MITKLKLLLITTFTASALLVHAQPEISWGVQSKAGGTTSSYIPLGWNAGHYYAVQIDGNDGFLMDVDQKMDLVAQKELITGGKKFEADLAIMRGGKINIIYSDFDGGEKANSIRASVFTTDGKATSTKLKKIATFKVERNSENTDVQYFYSADSSMMLIMMMHDMKRDEPAKVSIAVLNTNTLEEVWSTDANLPYDNQDVYLTSAAVQKNGDVLLLTLIKGDDGKRLERYSSHAFSFTGKTGEFDEKTLSLDGKFISSGRIRFINDKKMVITGFYNDLTEKGKNEGIEGAFIAIADPNDLSNIDFHVKKMDILTKTSIVRTGAFAKFFDSDELNAYIIREINLNEDGSGYVIGEQRYIVESTNQSTVTRTYYFNHLILFRFDANQEIAWISTIPKVQYTSISTFNFGRGPISFHFFTGAQIRLAYKYNSFLSTEKDGEIYVLYNDHRDNGDARTLKDVKPMGNKNRALATIALVDPNGKWEKTALFRGKDLDVILETSSSFRLPGSGFTISAERGKNLQYGKLEF